MGDIRHFFTADDIAHMGAKGIDLSTYDGVKTHATDIYMQTQAGLMPPDPYPKWSADQVQTFLNWMTNHYPLGTAVPDTSSPRLAAEAPPERVRKDVTSLSPDEIQTLEAGFKGLMQRDPSEANSYSAIAGMHGRPKSWCMHHVNPFNPWHRAYLKIFEDALRSVPGCEALTMPYWDLTTPLPDLLQQPPFATYELPNGAPWKETERYPPAEITQNLQTNEVLDDIATSLKQSLWGVYAAQGTGYQQFSIQAHDGGHVSIGPTMADQDWASYDPVFWFYHCNLDRLWLSWQQLAGATTLDGFKSTLSGSSNWLSPPLNGLTGFPSPTSDQTIAFGIGYDRLEQAPAEEGTVENLLGSLNAARSFTIRRSSPVSVRVKDIDRLKIPGSFVVKLLADGEPIAQRAFFQPKSPTGCDNCRENPLASVFFRLDQEQVVDRKLSVAIELVDAESVGGPAFPLSRAGDPSINVRLLLEDA